MLLVITLTQDLYFNTSCHQDQAISLQPAELLESSFEDELTDVETSVEEMTVQHPQPVVARLLAGDRRRASS